MSLISKVIKLSLLMLLLGSGVSFASKPGMIAPDIVPVVQPRIPTRSSAVQPPSAYQIVPVFQPRVPVVASHYSTSEYEIVPVVQPRIPVHAN